MSTPAFGSQLFASIDARRGEKPMQCDACNSYDDVKLWLGNPNGYLCCTCRCAEPARTCLECGDSFTGPNRDWLVIQIHHLCEALPQEELEQS